MAMSRYVDRVSKAAAKICGLNRGSVALTITSAFVSRTHAMTDSVEDASRAIAANRPSSRLDVTARARSAARSARVIRSKKERCRAIRASAAPTPPAPMTRTFTPERGSHDSPVGCKPDPAHCGCFERS
jgi:hypothetical protein